MHPLLHRMVERLPEMLAGIGTLVRCESPSADHDAVARSADVVTALGTPLLGGEPERIVLDGVTHLRWRKGTGDGVLLLGHHDTVWPVGSLESRPFHVENGILRGPGCFDMKAGLVMAMYAATELDDVTLLVTGDEELGSPSSRELVEEEAKRCVAALVLEASADGGALKTERKGIARFEVHAHGRAAHAGLEPEKGVNATVELAHQILAVSGLADPAAGTTVTPTLLTSGTSTNTVPAHGDFAIDVRARTVAEQNRIDAALHALRPALDGATLTVVAGPSRPPLESAASQALYARAVALAAELGLPPLTRAAVGGGSDGNLTAGVGVPTLDGLGAVGGGAHADHEHVLVAELPGRAALVTALALDLTESRR
ncbi:glutamate carboxypeptidase [Virgisporangium aliadipatigenens]|uniref:Glutamate carboxypeptidase n=1 Tax=Virgisporangium aliadipatigenens TaxID=741659 RepID=A0A8J3YHV2_9ACTN|nr:M20 family metallopeptidase [Virgisporangium aliadipatigenens]GIJ45376.1 glutamate carboxypeptidase [Virgisporangium aliadipatigenens]